MDVVQVFPDEPSDAGIVWYGFISPLWGFKVGSWSLDHYIIYKRLSNARDFGLKDKGNITVEYSHGVGGSHWEGCVSECTKGGLKACEVARGNVDCPVIVAHKEIQHGVTRVAGNAFDELINKRGNCGILDGDSIQWLQVVYKSQ